jgi:hypothetical protein
LKGRFQERKKEGLKEVRQRGRKGGREEGRKNQLYLDLLCEPKYE